MMIMRSLWRVAANTGRCTCAESAARTLATIPEDEKAWETVYQREIPRTLEEMGTMLGKEVDSPLDARLLKVAVIGLPNSGKSTLINKLVGWRVCSVSSKVHTTEVCAQAIHNIGSTQLVFLDTPGLVTQEEVTKHRLKRSLLTEAEMSLQEADLMAVVHDASNHFTRHSLHPRVLRLLVLYPTIPSVLVLNKTDRTKCKQNLLDMTRLLTGGTVGGQKSHNVIVKPSVINKEKLIKEALSFENCSLTSRHHQTDDSSILCRNDIPLVKSDKDKLENMKNKLDDSGSLSGNHLFSSSSDINSFVEKDILEGRVHLTEHQVGAFVKDQKSWPKFKEVFMISALDGFGVDDFRDFLVSSAYSSPWIFSSQVVTDQNPQDIAVMTVREKFLDAYGKEIPYTLEFKVEYWELSDSEVVNIVIQVGCKRRGLARLLVGQGGISVSRIARRAEQSLRNTYRTEVRLRLNIVCNASLKNSKKH